MTLPTNINDLEKQKFVEVAGEVAVRSSIVADIALPAGIATEAKQDDGNASLVSIDSKLTTVNSTLSSINSALAGTLTVTGTVAVSGSVLVTNAGTFAVQATLSAETTKVIGTVNISAAQTIAVTNAGTFATQSAQSGVWTVQPGNTANTTAWKVDGSAVTQPVSGTIAFSNSTIAVTNVGIFAVQSAQSGSWAVTANAGTNLNTSLLATEATLATLSLAQASTTSGQLGPIVQGAATMSAPTYTTAKTYPLSLTTAGDLRTVFSNTTIAVTNAGTFAVQIAANSSVNVSQVNGVTTSTGSGIMGTGTIRVAIASDNDAITVKQATAGNLNATVVGSGTFTTNQTTAAATWQAEGSIDGTSLTGSYQTILTAGGSLVWIALRNSTDGYITVSLDSGTTAFITLEPLEEMAIDLKILGKSIAAAVTIRAKYSGSAPTTGTFRVNGFY